MLARGFENWRNTRPTRAGYVATFAFVLVLVLVINALGVPFPIGLAIAVIAGLALRPVFRRHGWTYVKKTSD